MIYNMKRISLFLIIVCFTLFLWAQSDEYTYKPFIMDGTCEWVMPIKDISYYKQTISAEDTVIQGKTYKKIVSQDCEKAIKEYSGAIREEDKRVYYISSEKNEEIKEKILFDFNLKVGEHFFYDYLDRIGIEVAYIDTVQIEKIFRKRYFFYLLDDNNEKGEEVYHFDSWIEGIGSEQGLLLPFHPIPTSLLNFRVACVHQGEKVLYRDYNDSPCHCGSGQSIEKNSQNNLFRILQNPIKDNLLSIELKESAFSKIDIYSWDGKLLLTKGISIRNGLLEIPVANLSAGNYIVILSQSDNSRESVRIVVL